MKRTVDMTKRNPFCGSFRSERFLNDLLVLPTVCIVTLLLLLLLLITPSRVESHTHLKLDKTTGLIDPVLDSAFTLQRPFDLVSLLNQIERFYRLEKIKSFIAAASPSSSSSSLASSSSHDKNGDNLDSFASSSSSSSNFHSQFYSTDADCVKAGRELNKFSFFETYLHRWRAHGLSLPPEILKIKSASVDVHEKPYCDSVTELPFSMNTYDHFESIQKKEDIRMKPDATLSEIQIENESFYGHLISLALSSNKTSWVYLTMASEYFRLTGDFANAVKCLQRAIYFSPKSYINIPRLGLSNLLHKLEYTNESLSILLSNIAENMENSLIAYYLGNNYATLGDLKTAYTWFDRSNKLDSNFEPSYLKKHAVACHMKLEKYLDDQHQNLQKKLNKLKDYQMYTDEWSRLNAAYEIDRSPSNRKQFTLNFYDEFRRNAKTSLCTWDHVNDTEILCHHYQIHYSYCPFNLNDLKEVLNRVEDLVLSEIEAINLAKLADSTIESLNKYLSSLVKNTKKNDQTDQTDSNQQQQQQQKSKDTQSNEESEKVVAKSLEDLRATISKERSFKSRQVPTRSSPSSTPDS